MRYTKSTGLTLLELILVMVVVAILGAMSVPRINQGIENHRAKAALETLRSISQAVRMYHLNTGDLPDNLEKLEEDGYTDPSEYERGYEYSFISSEPSILAERDTSDREITLILHPDTLRDEQITDSAGFLTKEL